MPDRHEDRPARLASVRWPEECLAVRAVRLDERRDGLRVQPAHAGRPQERRIRSIHLRPREVDRPRHLPRRPQLDAGRCAQDDRGAGQRGGDRAVGVRRDHDHREGASGPCQVDQAAHVRGAVHFPQGGVRGVGQDAGGDGHAGDASRAVGARNAPVRQSSGP